MKKTFVIFFKDGQMMAFEMPQEISLVGYSKGLAIKMLNEYKQLVETARLSALPVSKESEEKVKWLIWDDDVQTPPPCRDFENWQPNQTKEYQIEAELMECYQCDGRTLSLLNQCPGCHLYSNCVKVKVLVLVESL